MIKRFASSFASRQFLAFLLTGGFAASVNFGTRILYNLVMPFSAAIICAYVTGMVTAFVLNRLFVFRDSTQATHQMVVWFVLVNVVAVAQTWTVSMLMLKWGLPALGVTDFTHEIAHAVGIVVPVFSSYLGHKHFSFR
nr:GtrA family protein [uncultured Massilia sp.]